jgi:bifunctional NMN adenylyltransferase/nudix hydrolase
MTNSTGVIVARFQTDELHEGHKKLITHVVMRNKHVLIFLGVGRTPNNATNPLTFKVRAEMVLDYVDSMSNNVPEFSTVTFQALELVNERYNDAWSKKLDGLIEEHAIYPDDVTLYSGRDGFAPYYTGDYNVEVVNFGVDHSSSTRREELVHNPRYHSADWRAGVIYAMNTKHFQTYRTVDMALIYDPGGMDPMEVLLVRKPNETKWRFPGGFVEEEKNETFAQAAARELYEETGARSEDPWELIQDFPMPDEWRIKNQKGVSHSTMLLKGWAMTRHAEAADDVADARWCILVDVVQRRDSLIMEEHRPLFAHPIQEVSFSQNFGGTGNPCVISN